MSSGQLKIVFNPMLDLGDNSLQAANAAECAGEQGQFWPMHDLLFERQREIFGGSDAFAAFAAELGLDTAAFNSCVSEQRHAEAIQAQDEARRQTGIRTRPTFDINGQLVVGAVGFDAFKSVIEPQLTE
ncbi:MAG: thioredoxin domain-containing protein [Anaerolineae bacterium]